MTIYMMVTDDKFELPLAVADSAPELAEMIGRNVNTIYSGISHEQHGRIKRSIYKKVEVEGCKKKRKNVSKITSRGRSKK